MSPFSANFFFVHFQLQTIGLYAKNAKRAATDRQPYKMGVLKIEISLTRSNFAVHIFDLAYFVYY